MLGLANCKYLFSHLKYKTKNILLIYLITNTYFFMQNIKPNIYLRSARLQTPIFSTKIENQIYT